MRAVIQRVKKASVHISDVQVSNIDDGFLVFLGICETDDTIDADYLLKKISNLRVFSDDEGKMNLSIKDIKGAILLVSQFTLYANTKRGNRPSFTEAMHPDKAIPIYQYIIDGFRSLSIPIQTGEFGADMEVSLLNDGPVTIIIDSKNK